MKNYKELQALLKKIALSGNYRRLTGEMYYRLEAGELGELKRAIDAACNEAYEQGREDENEAYWAGRMGRMYEGPYGEER